MAKGKKSGQGKKSGGSRKKSGEGKQQRASRGARRRGAGASGAGFFDSVWRGIKSVAKPVGNILWNDVAKPALQGSKIISNTLSKVPVVGDVAANFARQRGFGRGRAMHGAGMSIRH